MPLATIRFKPARLIRTSPGRPEADSRLVNAIAATVSAKTRPDHVGALPRWIGSSQRVRVEEQDQPEHDDERLQRQIARHAASDPPRAAPAEAADVAQHDQRDEGQREPQRLAAVAERTPEDAQVLGRRVGADRDQDHVVQQDRPAGDEADELVERVAREHGRAAAVGVQRRALDVGHRGEREQQRGDRNTSGVSPSACPAITPSEK